MAMLVLALITLTIIDRVTQRKSGVYVEFADGRHEVGEETSRPEMMREHVHIRAKMPDYWKYLLGTAHLFLSYINKHAGTKTTG